MNDSQKYKLIIWHSFLEDIAKVKDKIEICFPGYEIRWGKIAKFFNWRVNNYKKHDILYPWLIETANKRGPMTLCYEYLHDYEPKHGNPTTDFPNRYYCDTCQKFVMKNGKNKHLKTNKHNRYV